MRGPWDPRIGSRDPKRDPELTKSPITFDRGLVVAQRARPGPGLLRRPDVLRVEAPEEAVADVGEALPGHAHVALADAQGLHQQLGGVLKVLHRNLDGIIISMKDFPLD